MNQRRALLLSLCLSACGSEDAAPLEPFTKTLPPDEHGVRVPGSETGDIYGEDYAAGYGCLDVETTRLSLAQAIEMGLSVEENVAALEEPIELSLRWGRNCGERARGLPKGDTRIEVRREVVEVDRTTRLALGASTEQHCADALRFRSVVTLKTADGAVDGRFYSMTMRGGSADELFAKPDLRNFDGSLAVPIDLDRPHDTALKVTLMRWGGPWHGIISAAVGYSDDVLPWTMDELGIDGVMPAPTEVSRELEPNCNSYRAPVPRRAVLVPLSRYDGSREPPTCWRGVRYSVRAAPEGPFLSVGPEALSAAIDGAPVAMVGSGPLSVGPIYEGAHVRVAIENPVPNTTALVELHMGKYEGGWPDAFASCTGQGCIAVAEGVFQGFCH